MCEIDYEAAGILGTIATICKNHNRELPSNPRKIKGVLTMYQGLIINEQGRVMYRLDELTSREIEDILCQHKDYKIEYVEA